jgi:hypothetical protein
MSLEKLEVGDRVKLKDDWSKRGKLVEIESTRCGVVWDGSHKPTYMSIKDLVHFSYSWDNDDTTGMR